MRAEAAKAIARDASTEADECIHRLIDDMDELRALADGLANALDDLIGASEHASESHYWSESDAPDPWDVARKEIVKYSDNRKKYD